MNITLFANFKLSCESSCLEKFFRVWSDYDVDSGAWFNDKTDFVFAVVGALSEQEVAIVDGARRKS